MTYSAGGLIQASDYNTFTTSSGGLNDIWASGSGDKGWGQTAFTSVSNNPPDTVTATQWATLVNNLATAGSQTGSTLTSRTAPTAGTTISILSAVASDITTVTTNRGSAVGVGAEYTTSGSSSGPAESSNPGGWNMTFTQTITFPSAAQARYFFNAGGIVRLSYSKSSTGTDKDPDWNALASACGTVNFTGRVNAASQTIAGTPYTGTTRLGGSGSPTVATTTGFYNLTPGAAATQIFIIYDSAPYTSDYIQTTVALNAGSTALTFVTTWHDNGYSAPGTSNNINAGAVTALSYFPPSTTYLTNSWGTPTLSSSVA